MRTGAASSWYLLDRLREWNRRRLSARRRSRTGLTRIAGPHGVVIAPTAWAWGVPDSEFLAGLAERISKVDQLSESVRRTPGSITVGREDAGGITLSIIIAAYGKLEYTLRCLQSIQEHAPSCTFEVIVIEDASGELDAEQVAAVNGVRFIRNETNLGYLRSCNKAVKAARGEFICLLNNDTAVTANALDALLDLHRRRSDAGIVGSKLIYPNGCLQEAGGVLWNDGWALNYGRFDDPEHYLYEYVRPVDYVSGASMLMRKELWDRLGGYDEHYCPAYGEDTDLAVRVRQVGLQVLYQPRSVVVHWEGVSHGTSEDSGLKAYQRVNRDKLAVRWGSVFKKDQLPKSRGVFLARERAAKSRVVLVIDHYVPEPDRDAGSRTMFQMLEALVRQGFVVKFWPDNLHYIADYVRPLQDMGVEVIYGSQAPLFSTWIRACGSDIGYVLVSRPTVARDYLPSLRKHTSARIAYYGHDLHFARMALQAKVQGAAVSVTDLAQMKALERSVWKSVDVVMYPSIEEINTVKTLEPEVNAQVICPYAFPRQVSSDRLAGRQGLLFVAGFQHPPNVDAALWLVREVMPLLRQINPDLHLTLAGSNPTDEVKALAGDMITVTGSVSDAKLSELYESARVALIPLRFGAGIKLKVVEAMYKGVPLVTTSIGIQGLQAIDRVVLVADEAQAFADAVSSLLSDDQLWLESARRQRDYVAHYFSPDAMSRGLMTAFDLPIELRAANA